MKQTITKRREGDISSKSWRGLSSRNEKSNKIKPLVAKRIEYVAIAGRADSWIIGTTGKEKQGMNHTFYSYDEPDDFYDDDDDYCDTCGDTGLVVNCPDDLCQGEAGCIHGDNLDCPDCDNIWLGGM